MALLVQALGEGLAGRFRVVDSIEVAAGLSLDRLRAAAVENNRELAEARSRRSAALLARREVGADRYPSVDLTLGYVFNDLTSEVGLRTLRPGGFNYGVTASLDLFDGYNRSRREANADIQIRNADILIAGIESSIDADLVNEYDAYAAGLILVAMEEENAELAAQNVEVALEQFRLGIITSVELREVQNALLNARSRLVAARFEVKQAEIRLYLLSGQLLERLEGV